MADLQTALDPAVSSSIRGCCAGTRIATIKDWRPEWLHTRGALLFRGREGTEVARHGLSRGSQTGATTQLKKVSGSVTAPRIARAFPDDS
jgi:hypothetical protein